MIITDNQTLWLIYRDTGLLNVHYLYNQIQLFLEVIVCGGVEIDCIIFKYVCPRPFTYMKGTKQPKMQIYATPL